MHRRPQEGAGRAPAPAALLVHLEVGAAEVVALVEHLDLRDAAFGSGLGRSDLVVSTKIYWGGSGPNNDKTLNYKHVVEGTYAALERLRAQGMRLTGPLPVPSTRPKGKEGGLLPLERPW